MGVLLNTCVALGCFVRKTKRLRKRGKTPANVNLILIIWHHPVLAVIWQYNLKVKRRNIKKWQSYSQPFRERPTDRQSDPDVSRSIKKDDTKNS